MKNKFIFLTKESIRKKIGTKSFKLVNILLLFIVCALINLDSLVKFFGGEFEEVTKVYVIDNIGVYEQLKTTMESSYLDILDNYNAELELSDKTKEELNNSIIEEESTDIIINITASEEKNKIFNAEVISYDYVDTILYQNIVNAINTTKVNIAMIKENVDPSIFESVEITRILLNENLKENEELMELVGTLIVIVFIVPFFILIVLIIQMIGAEINEEKSSRSMEIIISSVSPEIHFMSKLISANVFAIVQGALLIIYSLIGGLIRMLTSPLQQQMATAGMSDVSSYINMFIESDMATKILQGIPLFTIIIILSFLAYSLLIGILASMTTNMEDFNQIQTPAMIFLMIGYFLAIYSTVYQGAYLIKFIGYVPFISGILAPVLYTLGEMTALDLGISIGLLIGVCVLLYKYGLKIYKVGILNYSSSDLWKKIFKSLKD